MTPLLYEHDLVQQRLRERHTTAERRRRRASLRGPRPSLRYRAAWTLRRLATWLEPHARHDHDVVLRHRL